MFCVCICVCMSQALKPRYETPLYLMLTFGCLYVAFCGWRRRRQPVRSYEVGFLVHLLNRLSTLLNDQVRLVMATMIAFAHQRVPRPRWVSVIIASVNLRGFHRAGIAPHPHIILHHVLLCDDCRRCRCHFSPPPLLPISCTCPV